MGVEVGRLPWIGVSCQFLSHRDWYAGTQESAPELAAIDVEPWHHGLCAEHVIMQIACHESARTTKRYDRTSDEVSVDEIERTQFSERCLCPDFAAPVERLKYLNNEQGLRYSLLGPNSRSKLRGVLHAHRWCGFLSRVVRASLGVRFRSGRHSGDQTCWSMGGVNRTSKEMNDLPTGYLPFILRLCRAELVVSCGVGLRENGIQVPQHGFIVLTIKLRFFAIRCLLSSRILLDRLICSRPRDGPRRQSWWTVLLRPHITS
jgi:hypothetical protein